MAQMPPRILIYLLRRDLRLTDNPVFHEIQRVFTSSSSSSSSPRFTHLLPIFVFPANQVEVSGFLSKESAQETEVKSPYPPARSEIGGYWRTGPLRSKFLVESVTDLRKSLEDVGSGLAIRAGMVGDVVRDALDFYEQPGGERDQALSESGESGRPEVEAVWMTAEDTTEERRDERTVRKLMEERGKEFRLFKDEKYFIDDRDLPFKSVKELPDVYTTHRKSLEPLRSRPRPVLPKPRRGDLPPFPSPRHTPSPLYPFVSGDGMSPEDIMKTIMAPLEEEPGLGLKHPPKWPSSSDVISAHPFEGGETVGYERVWHLLATSAMTNYKDTRNGLLGLDFSTKLSGYLSYGSLSSRWIHWEMRAFEDGTDDDLVTFSNCTYLSEINDDSGTQSLASESEEDPVRARYRNRWRNAAGFGEGENRGTGGVRFELLWRDYMSLCARKFGPALYHIEGFQGQSSTAPSVSSTSDPNQSSSQSAQNSPKPWKYLKEPGSTKPDRALEETLDRFRSGRTGIGLIDASQRELYLTGYTSNRARQNVASFLSKHLGIDWRLGAEWYESMLVDYDAASNWGNWQYVAGVGNDPRQGRTFNPVKQGLEYDKGGEYVRSWVEELRLVGLKEEEVKEKAETDEGAAKLQAGDNSGEEKLGSSGKNPPVESEQERLMPLFQAWRLDEREKERLGLKGVEWVENPLVKIPFSVGRRPRDPGAPGRGGWWRGQRGRGGGGGYRGRGRGRPGGPEWRRV
ncbi:cryptochrome [Aulographum hederae CBS 113979]|uniref:Cryptochrome DASH n=1 Tax=Aulographum hederae CBS 113979 TaxID=1176131 RepID=A0A6G1HEL9_9PEZI|nr:cryptochrome [Aulographum hederae CBS 113979]